MSLQTSGVCGNQVNSRNNKATNNTNIPENHKHTHYILCIALSTCKVETS